MSWKELTKKLPRRRKLLRMKKRSSMQRCWITESRKKISRLLIRKRSRMKRSKNKRLSLSQKILKSKKLLLRLSITSSNLSQA
jgi:hypothetical protein